MIYSKEIKDKIMQLFPEGNSCVTGKGIRTDMTLGFDKEKLNEKKSEIATILHEIGIDEVPMIKLLDLTHLKDGTTWNPLQNMEDFQALELLLACSNACGFILNNNMIMKMNINSIGDINSLLISSLGRSMIDDDDKWLQLIRETIADKMYFLTEPEIIKDFVPEDKRPLSTSKNLLKK